MIRLNLAILLLLLFVAASYAQTTEADEYGLGGHPITVYTAKKVITMERSQPQASAIAVAKGRIVSVGSLQSMQSWLRDKAHTVDDSFKDKIIMPGFIEPHVHPSLPAILTQFPFIAPEHWSLPSGEFAAAGTPEQYLRMLKKQVDTYYQLAPKEPHIPFVAWGYHPLWHGDLYRTELDRVFADRPVILWHRSFHELIANSAALNLLGINEQELAGRHGVDWLRGHFWEMGAQYAVRKMPFLFAADRYLQGMQNFVRMLHRGGVTTAMDMGTGIFGNAAAEVAMIQSVMDQPQVPTRMVLTPIVTDFISRQIGPRDALAEVEAWTEFNSEKVFFARHFKLMLDGAIFSGLAQFQFPGYIDGHSGEWLVPMATSLAYAEAFWNAGYQIHAHTNGDKSTARLIDIVATLLDRKPRLDHRTTLEHFAYSTDDQLRQLDDLGVAISANPYYQYILSDQYADKWLGEDRARNMVPLGRAVKAGITVSLHSDSPMAPLSPLTLAWAAVNRTTINGNANNPKQKLSLDQALRAITIDAAWVMNMEHQIGSIRAGKKADLVVLEQDPYTVKPENLRDIRIWGTVFEGRKFPLQ